MKQTKEIKTLINKISRLKRIEYKSLILRFVKYLEKFTGDKLQKVARNKLNYNVCNVYLKIK